MGGRESGLLRLGQRGESFWRFGGVFVISQRFRALIAVKGHCCSVLDDNAAWGQSISVYNGRGFQWSRSQAYGVPGALVVRDDHAVRSTLVLRQLGPG